MTLTQLEQERIKRIDAALREMVILSIEWGDTILQELISELMEHLSRYDLQRESYGR